MQNVIECFETFRITNFFPNRSLRHRNLSERGGIQCNCELCTYVNKQRRILTNCNFIITKKKKKNPRT